MRQQKRFFTLTILAFSMAYLPGAMITPASAFAQNDSTSNTNANANMGTKTFADVTKGMKSQAGFFPVYSSVEQGRVLLAVPSTETAFLMMTSLPFGLGSNDVGLDRGQTGDSILVHFERQGKRVFLVQENTRYLATSNNADERASVREAFASSVLWSGDILATENNQYLIDFSSFLLSDRHGVAARLNGAKQGNYSVDEKRSAVLAKLTKNFPDNTEMEAMLTFAGNGEGEYARQVAADAKSLRLQQHISFVRLPTDYVARDYHPSSGGMAVETVDYGTPLSDNLFVQKQARHRLEKTDPTAAVSTVKKPIIYYLDRGTPEPVRSALLDGARWWAGAFEKAGFKDAYKVEMLPEGADPMDVRYNMIMWVHRATRGWSYGNSIVDPRTGEIIKGAVTLGSLRVRQDILIAESLLAPYGKTIHQDKKNIATQMALARLRQLAAHEVGHTLGIAHNFAASRQGNGSVMDYPHPLMGINAQGEIDISKPYGVGLGAWDEYVIQYLYSTFPNQNEEQSLAKLREKIKADGLKYVSDSDSRAAGATHKDGLLWEFGSDSLSAFDQIFAVRKLALKQFSTDVLPPQRQLGELEARLVPVYLLHRYQTEAVARLIAGGDYEFGTAQDANDGRVKAGVTMVDAATQRAALQKLMLTLRAENLALPQNVLAILTPQSEGYSRNREYFSTNMSEVFDPFYAAQAATANTLQFMLDAERLNRLAWQQAQDVKQLGVAELFNQVYTQTWKREAVSTTVVAGDAVQLAANWVIIDASLALLENKKLHPQVKAEVRQALSELAQWLQKNTAKNSVGANRKDAANYIQMYLRDPSSVKLRAMPIIPPGAPI